MMGEIQSKNESSFPARGLVASRSAFAAIG